MPEPTEPLVSTSIGWLNTFFSGIVARIVIAVLILLIGIIVGKLVEKLISRGLKEFEFNAIMRKAFKTKISFEDVTAKTLAYLVYFLAFVAALNKVGLTKTVFLVLSVIVGLFLVLSIVLGIRDFVPNVLAGLFRSQPFRLGDRIQVGNIVGTIVRIRINEVCVETKDKEILWIPNSAIRRLKVKKKT